MNLESFLYMFIIFLLGLLSPLIKEWVVSKTKYGVKHSYDTKLEYTKASMVREAVFHASAFSSFAEGQKAAMERRLSAIDVIWMSLLQIKKKLPPIVYFTDILTVEEHLDFIKRSQYQEMKGGWTQNQIIELIPVDTEKVRPFLHDYIWTLYFAYQSIFLRASLLICDAEKKSENIKWFDDIPTNNLIKAVLTEQEYKDFQGLNFRKVSWLQETLETKILKKMREVISGQEFITPSIEQLKNIKERLSEVEIK